MLTKGPAGNGRPSQEVASSGVTRPPRHHEETSFPDGRCSALGWLSSTAGSLGVLMLDRVTERRRAAQLARHYRDQEGLSIGEIARRLGRADATIKAYLHDPTGDKARAVKARYRGVCRGCGAPHRAPERQGRRLRVLQLRREAPCCIPGAAGRNSKGCSWVQWLTRIRKVKGTIACQESDGRAQVSGVRRRGTRVIWRKLDCLKPNLQKMKRRIRRKGTCYRRHALRWHFCRAVATFGAWSVAQ